MCMPLHPYLIGAPHRIAALDEILAHVTAHEGVWLATGREIAQWWKDHHQASVQSWLEGVA